MANESRERGYCPAEQKYPGLTFTSAFARSRVVLSDSSTDTCRSWIFSDFTEKASGWSLAAREVHGMEKLGCKPVNESTNELHRAVGCVHHDADEELDPCLGATVGEELRVLTAVLCTASGLDLLARRSTRSPASDRRGAVDIEAIRQERSGNAMCHWHVKRLHYFELYGAQ